jgi:heptaprenyl diphosphate synthase
VAAVASSNPLSSVPALGRDLERVESQLRQSVQAEDPFLTEVASHLIMAGGKRVRPAFAVTSAATGRPTMGSSPAEVISGAVSVELVHLGSLYHDDVIDDASTRRKVETVNARWGNLKAILAGDYLLARASEIAASLGTEVAGLLAATIARLCEGQILELQRTFDPARTEESYLSSIDGKTAALLATACRIGGIVGELPRTHIDALTRFGHSYGMAFQIVDDILDVTATDEELGKPSGNDLVQGVYTLPVIRTLAAGGSDADRLGALLGRPLSESERDEARDIVRASGQIDGALDVAKSYADDADEALRELASSEAGAALTAASDHLVETVRVAGRR